MLLVLLNVNPYLSNSGHPVLTQAEGLGLLQQSVRPNRLFASSHWLTSVPRKSMHISPLAAQHHTGVSCPRSETDTVDIGSGLHAQLADNRPQASKKRIFIRFIFSSIILFLFFDPSRTSIPCEHESTRSNQRDPGKNSPALDQVPEILNGQNTEKSVVSSRKAGAQMYTKKRLRFLGDGEKRGGTYESPPGRVKLLLECTSGRARFVQAIPVTPDPVAFCTRRKSRKRLTAMR